MASCLCRTLRRAPNSDRSVLLAVCCNPHKALAAIELMGLGTEKVTILTGKDTCAVLCFRIEDLN